MGNGGDSVVGSVEGEEVSAALDAEFEADVGVVE